jgi:16S rRNA (guanine527-N7)-methyltransferase
VKEELRNLLARGLTDLGVHTGAPQLEKLAEFGDLLRKGNKATRLVANTTPRDLAYHILDSAAVLRLDLPEGPLLDIGSGGGLPGIPLAIMQSDRPIILLESRQRRATFLEHVCFVLKLNNVQVICARYEDAELPDATIAISRALTAPDAFLSMLKDFSGPCAIVMTNVRVFPVRDHAPWAVAAKDHPPIGGPPRHLNVLFSKT